MKNEYLSKSIFNVALLGPCEFKNKQGIGGIIVLFNSLIKVMKLKGIRHTVFDTNLKNYPNKVDFILKFLIYLFQIRNDCKCMILNATAKDVIFLSPVIIIYGYMFNKKIVLRKFAGDFDEYYVKSGFIKRWYLKHLLLKFDLLYFETLSLVEYFKSFNKIVKWFPNVREVIDEKCEQTVNNPIRLLYISQLMESKGLLDAISATELLGDEYHLSIAGPIVDEFLLDIIKGSKNITYLGKVDPSVVSVLNRSHDVFLFPTYYESEGYPGVLIEALAAGIPIVATNWRSIPEVIEGAGKLVDIKSPIEIAKAVTVIIDNYQHYCTLSAERGKQFCEIKHTDSLLLDLAEITR